TWSGVSFPSSTKIAPISRSERTSARGGSKERTFSCTLMRMLSSGGARQRLGLAAAQDPRRMPRQPRAQERRLDADLEVARRAHAAVEQLEEEDRGESQQHADEDPDGEIERHARPERQDRLDRGIEDRDVGLARGGLDLVHEEALQRRVVG